METHFVLEHVALFNMSVRLIWLGRNLRHVVDILYAKYLNNPSSSGEYQKFIVMDYTPSLTIDGAIEFTSIAMPECREILRLREGAYCAYSEMPAVKYYKLPQSMKTIESLTDGFTIEERTYRDLIKQYEEKVKSAAGDIDDDTIKDQPLSIEKEDSVMNSIACDFVKNHPEMFHTARATKPEYAIGVLLPSGPSIYGNIQATALEAIAAVNRNPDVLPHIELTYSPQYVTCEARPLIKSYLAYHNLDRASPVIGIIGPPCTHGTDSVSKFSEVISMATMSYGATATSYGPAKGNSNFFRTVGESSYFADAVIAVLEQMNWKRIAILSEEGLTSSYVSVAFDSRLKERGIEVLAQQKMPAMENTRSNHKLIADRLNDLKERRARIILMEIYDLKTATQIMCQAKNLNMTAEEDYVWIVPSWIGDSRISAQNTTTCSREEVASALDSQFSFDFRSFGDDNQTVPHLGNTTIGTWLKQNNATVSNYTGFIYDAVWTYAFAFDRLMKSGNMTLEQSIHYPNQHNQFLDSIMATNFTGLSGRVEFAKDQSRRLPVIFSQRQGSTWKRVGSEDSLTNSSMVLYSEAIAWKHMTPPSDGRIICSVQSLANFLNVTCDTAILVMTVFVSFIGAVLASLAFYIYVRRFYNKKMAVSRQVMRNLGIDLLNTNSAPENLLLDWEMPKDQIMLNRKLGEGAFGTVYGGQAYIDGSREQQAVAVKTLKIGSTSEDRLDFLSEAEAMRKFNHPNILKLLGVCLQSEPIFNVIEFMLYGDLKTYLLARRHLVKERIPDDSDISAKRLTLMASDILRGLAYLAEMKYVHRDIACRNCLVNADRRVKIADFGMARPTGSNDYYRFSRKGLLPVRWLSPESLGSGFFTPASDIWSFGVLLFEIVTFGAFPYHTLSNNQVLEFVKNGGSMDIPAGVKPPLERIMRSCWTPDYKKRPSALLILEFVLNNPRLVAPCVEVPTFSIQFTDSESDDLDFMPNLNLNQSPDSGVGGLGLPITRENLNLQQLASMPTSQAAVDAFQMRQNNNNNNGNGHSPRGFLKVNGNGGVPNGNGSLTYNPIEPLLMRQNSNEMSNSTSSLFMRYVPMCGFGSSGKKTNGNGEGLLVGNSNNYSNSSSDYGRRNTGSTDDTEYTKMSITEF